jgi:flagellin-like hook-associated protein FlgL
MIQNRLATGKKVNTAVDNPVNYFTSEGLYDRAGQLSSLLDGMSNATKTIDAASKGIDGITNLVKSLQSTIKQAQADAASNRPTKAGTALTTAAETALTNKSLKDTTLGKLLVDDNGATANTATGTYGGNLGIAVTNTNLALEIKAGSITYNVTLNPATATVQDLVTAINGSGIATASVDDSGKLNVTGTGSSTLKIGLGAGTSAAAALTDAQAGGQNTVIGLAAADYTTGLSATGNSTVRSNLVSQFNSLMSQIDQIAKDAGYNGLNLLAGDKVSVVFNEKTGTNQSKLDVQGTLLSSASLGISQATSGTAGAGQFNIQDDTSLNQTADVLTGVLSSLRSIASNFGSNLSVIQTRQDFTKGMITALKTGADNLVLADQNEEGASLLALNTRQQLSQTALSLASQADQGVLRLFG